MTGRIVVGFDGSIPATAALDWAARQATELKIVHVDGLLAPERGGVRPACEELLAKAARRAVRHAPALTVTTQIAAGPTARRLIEEAEHADAIVIGGRGAGGFVGLALGSVALAVAGHARGPVIVVRGVTPRRFGEIVVGIDGSPSSEAALAYAFEEAELRGARVRAVHGWTLPMLSPYAITYQGVMNSTFATEARAAGEWLAPWRQKYPQVELLESSVCAHPVAALAAASETADLLVVGSRGLGGFTSTVLGSVGHGALHHAHCPVAVVRSSEDHR